VVTEAEVVAALSVNDDFAAFALSDFAVEVLLEDAQD
jgi:hypothetical protein